jgi:hypothetical protein
MPAILQILKSPFCSNKIIDYQKAEKYFSGFSPFTPAPMEEKSFLSFFVDYVL